MIKGLYTAASGMMLQMARQDVVANNIANVNTAGFKKDTALCRSFPDMLMSRLGEVKVDAGGREEPMQPVVIGGLGTGAMVDRIAADYSQGNIKNTDNPFDLALNGDGYFAVETPRGECFTRDGCFKLNDQGVLITNQGYAVLDQDDNPITIEGEFSVDSNGNLISGDELIATLKIVNFEDPQALEKVGDNMRTNAAYTLAQSPRVVQGYMEQSNVNAVKEMVNLITVVRAYESLQKVVQAEDQTLSTAIDQVGNVR